MRALERSPLLPDAMGLYVTRKATAGDLPLLGAIERAAGALFAGAGMPEIAEGDPLDRAFLEAVLRRGLVAVAEPVGDGGPVGFIAAGLLDGEVHIYEVSVHPDHGRRGLGRQLIDFTEGWAHGAGARALTLTTFRDIPWNAPFYARLGFRVLGQGELTPGLWLLREHEQELGLPLEKRCAMRKEIAP